MSAVERLDAELDAIQLARNNIITRKLLTELCTPEQIQRAMNQERLQFRNGLIVYPRDYWPVAKKDEPSSPINAAINGAKEV